jgi:hypothetical protein
MKITQFRCSVCKGAAQAIGYLCVCVGPATHEVTRVAPESIRITMRAPDHVHAAESETERQIASRPVRSIAGTENYARIVEGPDMAVGIGRRGALGRWAYSSIDVGESSRA